MHAGAEARPYTIVHRTCVSKHSLTWHSSPPYSRPAEVIRKGAILEQLVGMHRGYTVSWAIKLYNIIFAYSHPTRL